MIDTIHQEFSRMIKKKRIAKRLGIRADLLRRWRYMDKNDKTITLETKIKLLQRYGYRFEDLKYTDRDLVDAVKFYINQGQASRDMGVEYVMDKFKVARELKNEKAAGFTVLSSAAP